MRENKKITGVDLVFLYGVILAILVVIFAPIIAEEFWGWIQSEARQGEDGLHGLIAIVGLGLVIWLGTFLTKTLFIPAGRLIGWAVKRFAIVPIGAKLELKKLQKNPYWNGGNVSWENLIEHCFPGKKYIGFAGDGRGGWTASKIKVR